MGIGDIEVGPKVEAVHMHGAKLPEQKPGEHLWIVMSMFKVTPREGGKYFLDMESLLTIEGPGCYWCEETWSSDLASKPCKGQP